MALYLREHTKRGADMPKEIDVRKSRYGTMLKSFRQGAGLSLREVTEKTGISSSAIIHIEQGSTSPNLETVDRLLTCYGQRPLIDMVGANLSGKQLEKARKLVERLASSLEVLGGFEA